MLGHSGGVVFYGGGEGKETEVEERVVVGVLLVRFSR
jgi:hypothetical protein